MSTTLAPRLQVQSLPPLKRRLVLTCSFWLFSYFFLALRKFLSVDDFTTAISVQRLVAISVGAFAYWLVVRQIETEVRVRLGRVVGWTVLAALAILAVRVGLSNLLTDDPVPFARSLRWTLTWSAYFAMWVVGAVAYLVPAARSSLVAGLGAPAPAPTVAAPARAATPSDRAATAEVDELSTLIEAIAIEAAADLSPADRKALAARVLRFGRYEVIGDDVWSKSLSVRASFAWRLATRLSRDY